MAQIPKVRIRNKMLPSRKINAKKHQSVTSAEILVTLTFVGAFLVAFFGRNFSNTAQAHILHDTKHVSMGQVPVSPKGSRLFFASVDDASIVSVAAIRGDKITVADQTTQTLVTWQKSEPVDASADREQSNSVTQMMQSPNGRFVAANVAFGVTNQLMITDLQDREKPHLFKLVDQGEGSLIGWHPDSSHVLYRADDVGVADPGLWIVDVTNGSHERVEIPELKSSWGLLTASFSPDGKQVLYATSKGMGFGSELYSFDLDTKKHELVWKDETKVLASLVYASDGKYIAFNTLLDSPVPFARSGLYVMDVSDHSTSLLTLMDGGHGQMPIWSSDGQDIVFVARDNLDNANADVIDEALSSSIRSVNIATGKEITLVPGDKARQVDISLAPTGEVLFSSNRSGKAEIWAVTAAGEMQQLTFDGQPKKLPIFLSDIQPTVSKEVTK